MRMNLKGLVVALLISACCVIVVANPQKFKVPEQRPEAQGCPFRDPWCGLRPTTENKEPPALKTEELLKIRDIQYDHAKRAARMKQIEELYERLQAEQAADAKRIDAVIVTGAQAAKINLETWIFNVDSLTFVLREKSAPAPVRKNQ
jgi:hypothetical protein